MNGHYNECTVQEVVIDSLYAQRHQQFVKHGRSQSESAHGFISSASSSGSRRERSTSAIFSIFRWFRKDSRNDDFDTEFAPSAPPSPQLIRGLSSSCGSVDTLFSTATASSFAFVHPALYRPFGAANPPEKRILAGPDTETYRNRLRQRDRIRELDKNLTLKKKYHLFGSGTLHRSADNVNSRQYFLNKSLDSLKVNDISPTSKNSTLNRKKRKAPPPPLVEEKPTDLSLPNTLDHNKENSSDNTNIESTSNIAINRPRHRRTVSDSAKDRKSGAFVHVRGKRKAPAPPVEVNNNKDKKSAKHEILGTQSLGRKKRPAPPPPLETNSGDTNETKLEAQGSLSPEEKQRLIDNIAKLQAHADRRSLLLSTPPDSPTLSNKMSHTVCNDSLKLEKGVLKANKTEVQYSESKSFTPTPVSPRPWYKRNSASKEKSLEKKKDKNKIDDWMPEVAIARGNFINQDSNSNNSCNSTNHNNSYRLSNIFSRFEKPEEKRKSQISMLANISELDREAAEIVQREQEKERALLAAHDAKYYTSVDEPTQCFNEPLKLETLPPEDKGVEQVEPPKRTGARELISLFNAIGSVTKVTVNSAFFSKEGPSIFTKEGIEKRFSMAGESVKSSEENIVKESITKPDEYKRETIIVETKELYLESPGIKRRRNLHHQDAKDDDSNSSTSLEGASPKVVIEEINDHDEDKSKTQALYEANKIRKHHSPSPSIPTITEMSESVSSVTTSPASTINASERSNSGTPTPVKPVAEGAAESLASRPVKNYSIWSCPRCTLENPRWRVTCEACDMWRPAVRRDVIDKLTNANMGATIAVNVIKELNEPKSKSAIKRSVLQTGSKATSNGIIQINNNELKNKVPDSINKISVSSTNSVLSTSSSIVTHSKPLTVSSLLSQSNYESKDTKLASKQITAPKSSVLTTAGTSLINRETSSSTEVPNKAVAKTVNLEQNNVAIKEKSSAEDNTSNKDDSDIEELRKARLAFFQKSQSSDKQDEDEVKTENSQAMSSVNQANINALFKNSSKGSLATNEEERLKVKEILKEMKNSLPKSKQTKSLAGPSQVQFTKDTNVNKENNSVSIVANNTSDAAKLGAIKKSTAVTSIPSIINSTKSKHIEKDKNDNKSEVYLIKSETIVEEIKVKARSSSSKVSTSVQTSGIVRQVEPSTSVTNSEELKPVTGKPPTPKNTRKEIIVPVTVEEHVIKNGAVQTTISKEPRKMGIGAFELIRPRDFINIEATKTGIVGKAPVHVYANVPADLSENSSIASTSSSSSENPEINQLTAELAKPNGLADFKAAVLESTAGNKMNTLAVNRLLRQLESAIAGGQHQRAATLAKELARHKVNCCVTRHKETDLIQVDMYVEDKLSHKGPFPVQVTPAMTVAQLKAKVEKEFEIPIAVQRWILGKELAADDKATLEQLAVTKPHSPIFLYLVAPDGGTDKTVRVETPAQNEAPKDSPTPAPQTETAVGASALAPPPGRGWYFNEEDDRYSLCESEVTDQSSKDPSPEPQVQTAPQTPELVTEQIEVKEEPEAEEEVEIEVLDEQEEVVVAAAAVELPQTTNPNGTLAIGWKCGVCTLVNSPTRPGCLACAADRPAEYQIPADHEASGLERQRMDQEQQTEQAAAEVKLKNYEQLMVLEKADLIPSTEPFECSVCLMECEAQDGVVLRDCLHTFCRACLAHTVQFTEEAEVKCPFRDHNYACDSTLQEREIKAVAESEEDDSCIVCMAEPRCCALTPCGHRAYCETCCLRLIELDHMCSLCRRKADGYLIIYL